MAGKKVKQMDSAELRRCAEERLGEMTEAALLTVGGRKPSLLLAEDDPDSRRVFELMLKRANYDLDIAEDGLKTIEMWERGRYDLVLMDVQMPRLNGYQATHAIRVKERERGGHTPIVAITAHAGKEDEARCLVAGMDAYISKPVDFMECLKLIGEIIKNKSCDESSGLIGQE